MFAPKKKKALGLDLGSAEARAVVLDICDGKLSISAASSLSLTDQGILNENEYCHAVRVWLEENKFHQLNTCLSLPQYLATVNIRDFPPNMESERLMASMINYETQHLSGISEENFINDYHVMPPNFGRANPVLIGICKESVINARVEMAGNIGLTLTELSLDSIAAANAFFALRPDMASEHSPKIILEISEQGSSMVIVAGKQILHACSLISSTSALTKEIAASDKSRTELPDSDKEPLQLLKRPGIQSSSRTPDSFPAEILNAIEHWHEIETSTFKSVNVSRVFISGPGSRVGNLPDYLEKYLGCPVEELGPTLNDGSIRPEFTVAYGLALAAIGNGEISISLCPADIRWNNKRAANFSFLAASAFLIVFAVSSILLGKYVSLTLNDYSNRNEILKLSRCDNLIPQLEQTIESINHHQRMMIPFVVKGNNANRFISALREIAKIAKSDVYFFTYVADKETFDEGGPAQGRVAKPGLKSSFFDSDGPAVTDISRIEPVDKMREISGVVIMGYTVCQTNNEHFAHLRKIQETLNESSTFSKGDILPDEQTFNRPDIMERWEKQVVNNRNIRDQLQLRLNRLRPFAISMPFAETNVRVEEQKK